MIKRMAILFRSTQSLGVNVKLLSPACILNPSNSTGLKPRLFRCSQILSPSQLYTRLVAVL